jgi:hypothetical protein
MVEMRVKLVYDFAIAFITESISSRGSGISNQPTHLSHPGIQSTAFVQDTLHSTRLY